MSIRELRSRRSVLAGLLFYLLTALKAFAASTPMTVSQLALYQGADREKVFIEGAKKEGTFTLYDSHTWFRTIAKQKGSPVEWRPLEPVVTTVGSSALMVKAPNPYTALLFIDFLLSKEGQQLIMKGGLWSPREDIGSLDQKFKKNYLDEKYSLEELEAKFTQWENLLRQLFIRKR